MKKLTLSMFVLLLSLVGMKAQSSCSDLNGYVDSKNTGGTGSYTLLAGYEEKAAQTYHYSGPGRVSSVRVYGNYPGITSGVPLRVSVNDVDANGRPTTTLQSVNATWWWFNNAAGYVTVYFGGSGVYVTNNFAITVEIRNASPWGNTFQLQYTGNGEGLGEDLASLAGTSTGNNWTSAMTSFNKDGDFYLVPRMTHYIDPAFTVSTSCIGVNAPVTFTNTSTMTRDSMFNTIGLAAYSGNTSYYSWDFGDGSPVSHATSPSHSYTTAGAYTVTLTCAIDGWNNDCSAQTTAVISVGLASTATHTNASCYGSSNASITVNATGGVAPYEYELNTGAFQSSNTFNGLPAGTYTTTVRDNAGCTTMSTVTITEPTAIVISNIASTNASCGGSDGALLITASGGTGTLQYQLNSSAFQLSNQFSNLASAFYTVTVKDANGCTVSNYAAVNNQGAPVMTIVSTTNVSCNGGNDGSIVLSATGGSGQLLYSIDGGNTWQTSGNFPNVSAGMHLVMVKDANGCSVGVRLMISQPQPIAVTAGATAVTCHGSNDGSAFVTSQIGGTGTFVYSLNNTNFQSSNTFNGLTAGNYTIYVRDVAGCTGTATVTVTEPAALAATATVTNAACNGEYNGSITVNVTGGIPGYSYSIDGENFQSSNVFNELPSGSYTITVVDQNGESSCQTSVVANITQPTLIGATITTGSSTCGNSNGTLLVVASGGSGSGYQYSLDGVNFSAGNSFSNLQSGNYNIVITDGTGCMNVFTASINDANGPSITSISHTDASCNGSTDGSITINTVTGGSGTLYYSVNGSTWQTSTNFSGLDAGSYSVLVKDANGCVGQTSVLINEPNPIIVTTSTTDVTCNGSNSGSVTINAAGGAGTLAYDLDDEINYQSSNVFNNLYAGTYLAIVRDAAGCLGTTYFTINEPVAITMNVGVLNVMCNGGTDGAIYVFASGGTGTLEYSLDGVNYQSSYIFTGLAAGNYTVFVRDANGCVKVLNRTISQPAVLAVTSTVTDVVCSGGNDGVVDLHVTGGTTPYSFSWSNDATTEDIFNLGAGTYSVTVTDNNGCSYAQSFTINQPANPLIVNGAITNASGQITADGSVDITITGGSAPYTFLWSNGATTEDISSVTPGVYTVAITDANGCVTSGTFTVSFNIGIADHNANLAITLYPNPAHESFIIDAGAVTIDKLEVLDMLGQVVYSSEPKTGKVQVSTDNFSQGVYFVRIYTNGQMSTRRMEVSK